MKPNLLFISGWNIKAEIFKPFMYNLEDKYNIYLFTAPVVNKDDNAYEKALVALHQFITQKKCEEDLSVLGWSMGGQLALKLASELKLKKLFLLSSAAVFSRNKQDKESFMALCESDFPRAVKYFHKLMGRINIEDSLILKNNFINDQNSAIAYLKSLHNEDLSNLAIKIKTKTTVFHAKGDAIIPFSEAENLNNLLDNSVLEPLDGDSHFPFFSEYGNISDHILGK